jgi:aminopeptidase C
MTYDHVMVIYGKAIDEEGKQYYMVKNSWGKSGQYKGIWYMSRDYIMQNTTYLFLNRDALTYTTSIPNGDKASLAKRKCILPQVL